MYWIKMAPLNRHQQVNINKQTNKLTNLLLILLRLLHRLASLLIQTLQHNQDTGKEETTVSKRK
jgi:hypothetical protein